MFQTASEKVEAECLAALHALAACLSRSVLSSDAEDLLDSFLSSILQGGWLGDLLCPEQPGLRVLPGLQASS